MTQAGSPRFLARSGLVRVSGTLEEQEERPARWARKGGTCPCAADVFSTRAKHCGCLLPHGARPGVSHLHWGGGQPFGKGQVHVTGRLLAVAVSTTFMSRLDILSEGMLSLKKPSSRSCCQHVLCTLRAVGYLFAFLLQNRPQHVVSYNVVNFLPFALRDGYAGADVHMSHAYCPTAAKPSLGEALWRAAH